MMVLSLHSLRATDLVNMSSLEQTVYITGPRAWTVAVSKVIARDPGVSYRIDGYMHHFAVPQFSAKNEVSLRKDELKRNSSHYSDLFVPLVTA